MIPGKFYWWIPLIGLFFIEEIFGWVDDSSENPDMFKKRIKICGKIISMHFIFGVIVFTILFLSIK